MRRVVGICAALAAATLVFVGQGASGSGGDYLVRGVFDNGGFLVNGENVRIAGATVGSVQSVDVTMPGEPVHSDGRPDPGKAVVVMKITDPGFEDFRQDASCLIRPQSLLGEKYVDCEPTQPRAPGTSPPPELGVIPPGEPGAGQRFLPLENNGKQVDLDLVQNIVREPYADRFRLILNDLGAGLAARGQDLAAIIERADPALRQTDRVLAELARQNRDLSALARDSDAVLAPLAREREHVAGFINNANTTAEATAERGADLEAGLQRFPGALRELRLTMAKLRSFSQQATPVFAELSTGAPGITRATLALGPFAHAATPALTSLGDAAQKSQQPIVQSDPILRKVRNLAKQAAPGAKSLGKLLASLRKTNGFKQLTKFLINSVGSVNGYDQYGHFLRAGLQFTGCPQLVTVTSISCNANWGSGGTSKARAPAAPKARREAPKASGGTRAASATAVPLDAQGDPAGGRPGPSGATARVARHAPSLNAVRGLLDSVIGPAPSRSWGGRG